MAGLNHVILMGNLTRDPEMKFTTAGKPLATFGVAVNRVPYTNEDGQRIEGVDFFNVVVHGRQAETVSQYLKKGSGVAIDGKLRYRAWQTDDGQKRSAVDVVGMNVQFLPRGGEGGAPPAAAQDDFADIDVPAGEGSDDYLW
jgi:single-strand DNA-binding protein